MCVCLPGCVCTVRACMRARVRAMCVCVAGVCVCVCMAVSVYQCVESQHDGVAHLMSSTEV